MENPTPKVGDQFKNPTTGTVNTITTIEDNHYYRGSNSYGPYYTLVIEGSTKTIQLTPAMLKRFTKL